MKRFTALALLGFALIAPLHAGAATLEGSISYGHLANDNGVGVTQLLSACDPDGAYQGVDGYWVDLDGEATASMTIVSGTLADIDVYFYDTTSGCDYIEGADLASGLFGEPESGPIPAGAGALLLVGYAGFDMSFELTLT